MSKQELGQGGDVEDWSSNIHDLIDKMSRRTFVHFSRGGYWQPAVNVYERREDYLACVEIAGVPREKIHVECVNAHKLVVHGVRGKPRPENAEGPYSVLVMEVDIGPFQRDLEFGHAIDVDQVEAKYREGYLWIRLPKKT